MNSLYRTSGDPTPATTGPNYGSLDELLADAARNAGLYVAGAPAGSTLTQISGPPWARTATRADGLLGAVWVGNVSGGEDVEFRLNAPDGSAKYGKVTLAMRQAVNIAYPNAFSEFSSTTRMLAWAGGAAFTGYLAWKFWPDGKRENPRRRR